MHKLYSILLVSALMTFGCGYAMATTPKAPSVDMTTSLVSTTMNNAGKKTVTSYNGYAVTVMGKTDLHITSATAPLTGGSTVDLQGENAWLFFDNVHPYDVAAKYLRQVTVDGKAIVFNVSNRSANNVRLAIYDNGCVVIPYGEAACKSAVTVYDGENFTGHSMAMDVNTYHNNLGAWDNKIRSFKLRRGFMATLANNANGTGFSKVFIADEADLEVPVLPEGMEQFVSFVRCFKWEWVSKKCRAGNPGVGDANKLDVTAYYNWSADRMSGDPQLDVEFSPQFHHAGWPSVSTVNGLQNTTHVLGYNEPDNTNDKREHPATAVDVIKMWPTVMQSGMRAGSPGPTSVWSWNDAFIKLADSLNYRVDFMVAHIYEPNLNAETLKQRIDHLSSIGGGRPVWITEWNNGANWTNEWWPDQTKNGGGYDRPYTAANGERQRKFMAECLPALDKMNNLERYYEYDWVQDARALVLGDTLTPAGKVYAEHKAPLAYRKADAYDFKWKIAPPLPEMTVSPFSKKVNLSWYDHNGETGKFYVVQRLIDSRVAYDTCDTLYLGKDYQAGGTVNYSEPIAGNTKAIYRVFAVSYKDTKSVFSRQLTFTRDKAVAAPVIKAAEVTTSSIRLTWDAVDGARGYRIERATKTDGDYSVVADNLTTTSFIDNGLNDNTTYYYRVYSVTTAAKDNASAVLAVTTAKREAPTAVDNVHVAAGDGKVSLSWDYRSGFSYNVYRAAKAEGDYALLSTAFSGSYSDATVTNGNTYYYKIQMAKGDDFGPLSEALEAQPVKGYYLHYAFDEMAGGITYDSWGGYNGTLFKDTTWEKGIYGGALVMSKDKGSYLKIANDAFSDVSDYTIAAWVRPSSERGTLCTFGSTSYFLSLVLGTGDITFTLKTAKGFAQQTFSGLSLSDEEWSHIALSQQGTKVVLYVNGAPVGEFAMDVAMTPADMGKTKKNYLGHPHSYDEDYCSHAYDDFRVYSEALSAADIASLAKGDEPTGIVTVYTSTTAASVYTLDGRKVCDDLSKFHALRPGVYVVGGRKLVVRH